MIVQWGIHYPAAFFNFLLRFQCMAESGIGPEENPSIDEISKCAYGQEGIELFAKLGKETPKHKWVPWVELNDVSHQS